MDPVVALVLRFLVLVLVSVEICCEVRFCHRGPQKVDRKECPYGVFFKKPVTSSCMFYAPEDKSAAPTYSTDICSADKTPMTPKTRMEATKIQKLEFGDKKPEDDNSGFDPINDPSCIEECFDTVEPWNLYKSDDEMPQYTYANTSCPLDALERQLNISEALFDYLIFGQDSEAKLPNNRIHQLLELCALVLMKHCAQSFVKPDFMLLALEALKYLHFTTNKGPVLEVSPTAFVSIEQRLTECLENFPGKLKPTGLKCASKAKIEIIEYTPTGREPRRLKYRVEPKSYRFGQLDIFIEAVWAALDFAHSFCYEEFRNFPYDLDMLVEHVGRIFSVEEIEERWYCVVELKNPSFWNNLAGVGDVKWTMRNIDFCAQAAAKMSVFHYRMDRPFEVDTDTPDSILLGPPQDKPGWKGTEDAYWRDYEKAGGVKDLLQSSDDGVCATDPGDLATFMKQSGIKC